MSSNMGPRVHANDLCVQIFCLSKKTTDIVSEYSLTKQLLKHLLCHCGVLWLFMVWLRVITYQLWVVLPLLLYHFVGITFMHLDREDTAIEDHVLAHFLIGWWCCWDFWIADRESYSPMGCQCNYACFMLIVIDVKILLSKLFLLQLGMNFDAVRSKASIIHAFPFNSEKKRGGVAVKLVMQCSILKLLFLAYNMTGFSVKPLILYLRTLQENQTNIKTDIRFPFHHC